MGKVRHRHIGVSQGIVRHTSLAILLLGVVTGGGGLGVGSAHAQGQASGALIGTVRGVDDPEYAAADERTGHVFVASIFGSQLSMLDAMTGEVIRSVDLPDGASAVAIDGRDDRVFVPVHGVNSNNDEIVMLDARSGDIVGTTPTGQNPYAVAIDESTRRVFVANRDDASITMIDAASGKALRTVAVGQQPRDVTVDERTNRAFVVNELDQSVSVLNATTGQVVRTVGLDATPWQSLVDWHSGRVFLTGGSGTITTLDATTGTVIATTDLGMPAFGGIVNEATNRVLLTNETDTTVSILDGTTGRLLRTVTVGKTPQALAVDARTGRAFVAVAGPLDRDGFTAKEPGSIVVLDSVTGAIQGRVAAGYNPHVIVTNTRTGRVFVGNSQDNTISVLDLAHVIAPSAPRGQR